MDTNKILTAAMIRLLNDKDIVGQKTLKDIIGDTIRVAKGARRPTIMKNPCFTVHILSAPRDPDAKNYNGTLVVSFYCNNHRDGNANIETMGPVSERIVWLFDDKPLSVDGYSNYSLTVQEPLGPLFNPEFPEEHYMSIRAKFSIVKLH